MTGRPGDKPQLEVHEGDLPETTRTLRDLLGTSGLLFDKGKVLVKLVRDAGTGQRYAREMTPSSVVMLAHDVAQPVKRRGKGLIPHTLPERVARMYLDLGDWGLKPLAGITTLPILRNDGTIVSEPGYDQPTQVFVDAIPEVHVPHQPTRRDAEDALLTLRDAFRTFPFADAKLDKSVDPPVVDLTEPPGLDESSFLAALLTAVCRPSLWLAPGVLVHAPMQSGSGSGKGLLLRSVSRIAFGSDPKAQTGGHDSQEFEKRLIADLVEGRPFVLLDNFNGVSLRCDALASALTERPSHVRILGRTATGDINSSAFIGLTGNGLTVSEDLARRILQVSINPRLEDPESRKFAPGFLDGIKRRRTDLLSGALTIWRWGRQNSETLRTGLPCGSYEVWAEWVRDPLLTVGCQDAVEGMRAAKQRDPLRQETAELFNTWWKYHEDAPVSYKDLNEAVVQLLCPHKQTGHALRAALEKLSETRAAGFVLKRSKTGKWTTATYSLDRAGTNDPSAPSPKEHTGVRNNDIHVPDAQADNGTGGTGTDKVIPIRKGFAYYKDPAYRRMRAELASRRAQGLD
jgi:hypothetical protein